MTVYGVFRLQSTKNSFFLLPYIIYLKSLNYSSSFKYLHTVVRDSPHMRAYSLAFICPA